MSRPADGGPVGLAGLPYAEQRDRVLTAWDDFIDVAEGTDLARPSRLAGWSGHDVVVHLGDWPGVVTLERLVAQATGRAEPRPDTDAANAAVVAAHRDTPRAEVLAALVRSRDRIDAWFGEPGAPGGPDEVGLRVTDSVVGPLPLLTVVAASAYELAVHALDLGPCGAPPAGPVGPRPGPRRAGPAVRPPRGPAHGSSASRHSAGCPCRSPRRPRYGAACGDARPTSWSGPSG